MSQTFTVSDAQRARVEIRNCRNRVTVVGWDDAQTIALDFAARQENNTVIVENANKVTVRVPRAITVSIANCQADVRVDDLSGRVELADINGDVALRNLRGETIVRDLDGDLAAKDVASLQGKGNWNGDVALRDVANVQAENVGGDLNLSDVASASIHQVEGDFVARGVKQLNSTGALEGDAVLRGVESANINTIEGDTSLGDVGAFSAQTLNGDLSAQNVRDALKIEQIDGDVNVRDSNATIQIEHADGDFIASNVRNALTVEDIDGDAVVSFAEIAPLDLRADGDIVLNLPNNANAEIELDAPRGDLVVRANVQVTAHDESSLRGTVGAGGAKIRVESLKGDVIMRQTGSDASAPFEPEHIGVSFARLGQEIAAEVRQSVHKSLADIRLPEMRAHRHRVELRMHRPDRHSHEHRRDHDRDREPAPVQPPAQEESPRPAAGSPERKAILDAIARGELNVDDAIKKLSGDM